jgi:hypothetical protein
MQLSFEKRWYDLHEIKELFSIKDKTMSNWLYDKKTGKKKNLPNMGIYKLPDTNYYVVNPIEFQDWFNKRLRIYQ